MSRFRTLLCMVSLISIAAGTARADKLGWLDDSNTKLESQLVEKYGEAARPRITQGLRQVSSLWRADDGDTERYEAFVMKNFAGKAEEIESFFATFEDNLRALYGYMDQIEAQFRRKTDLTYGEIHEVDEMFAAYSPTSHVIEDFFKNGIGFVVLLNFPLTTLDQRLQNAANWNDRNWAEARLASRFGERVPAEVNLKVSEAISNADRYTRDYNIKMHHLLSKDGSRLFPAKLSLLSHWNLRDEIRAQYDNQSKAEGMKRQEMIYRVMEHIVRQTIPAVAINNPFVDWNPVTNEVTLSPVRDEEGEPPAGMAVSNTPEPDTRYATLFENFRAMRLMDPYYPTAPTAMARNFDIGVEIPEARVQAIFEKLLSSPFYRETAKRISKALGRKLRPYDLWFTGFDQKGSTSQDELDVMTKKKYPTPDAFKADLPNIFHQLDFDDTLTSFLTDHIVVEPARGSGHAMGALIQGFPARLRTRIGEDGMDYKGYNIAIHELGHNVEQVFSLNQVKHWLLNGVPNTAITEAIAFVFQARDRKLLGLAAEETPRAQALSALHDYWQTCEIAGVSLVDIRAWHWMYDNPNATPAEFKQALLGIARDVWNKFYAPAFGIKDSEILAIYTHMISYPLYLSNYPLGHLVAFQIEDYIQKKGVVGPEIRRMVTIGNISPDVWMERATGLPISGDPMLAAVEKALKEVRN